MNIESDIPLKPKTTFRIGGNARHFVSVSTVADLKGAVSFSKEKGLPFFILGDGSNTLVPDFGFPGLVIKNEIRGIKLKEKNGTFVIEAGAGENWDSFVAFTISQKLFGLENLSYIPGSVGGAPVQNIGAYGAEVNETIKSVEVLDTKDMKLKLLSNRECKFSYRDSIFKQKKGKHFIITRVIFSLLKKGRVNIGYKDLKEHFKDRYSSDVRPAEVRDAVVSIRKNKLPDWKIVATAGSFFKNPIIPKSQFMKLKEKYPGIPGFSENGKIKIPLAWVLDKVCDLKGLNEGNVGLYERQPLTVVNLGDATFEEIEKFADRIAKTIKKKTEIEVEWEVRVMR